MISAVRALAALATVGLFAVATLAAAEPAAAPQPTATSLPADPALELELEALAGRLAQLSLRENAKVELEVERHTEGEAPLHRSRQRFRGEVTVAASPKGVRWQSSRGSHRSSQFSAWTADDADPASDPVLHDQEASELANPAAALAAMLPHLALVDVLESPAADPRDEDPTPTAPRDGEPSTTVPASDPERSGPGAASAPTATGRLLVFRPRAGERPREASGAITHEVRLWLGADATPLALERHAALSLGDAVTVRQQTSLRYAVLDDHLVVTTAAIAVDGDGPLGIRGSERTTTRLVEVR
jgi:hypothetical protein